MPSRADRLDLVDAQQARRALDYLVGFNLSPVLWRKVQRGLSAGRVQSPALRMIVEREEEIEAFISREYWSIEAALCASFSAALQCPPDQAGRTEVRAVHHSPTVAEKPAITANNLRGAKAAEIR